MGSLSLFCGPHTHAKVSYGQKQSEAIDAHCVGARAFTSELIRLRGQGRGSAHNEAGRKVDAEAGNAWSPRLTS